MVQVQYLWEAASISGCHTIRQEAPLYANRQHYRQKACMLHPTCTSAKAAPMVLGTATFTSWVPKMPYSPLQAHAMQHKGLALGPMQAAQAYKYLLQGHVALRFE